MRTLIHRLQLLRRCDVSCSIKAADASVVAHIGKRRIDRQDERTKRQDERTKRQSERTERQDERKKREAGRKNREEETRGRTRGRTKRQSERTERQSERKKREAGLKEPRGRTRGRNERQDERTERKKLEAGREEETSGRTKEQGGRTRGRNERQDERTERKKLEAGREEEPRGRAKEPRGRTRGRNERQDERTERQSERTERQRSTKKEDETAESRKRKCDEMEVSEISHRTPSTIHGVFVGEVSPVKCGRRNPAVKYFEGHMTDGKKTVQVVSFEPTLKAEVEKARKSTEGVALTNCLVQESKQPGKDFEIKATSETTVAKSPKKFGGGQDFDYAGVSAASELRGLTVNQHVTVTGKVTLVKKAEDIHVKSRGETLKKQDFVLSDCGSSCRGVVWEKDVGGLKVDCSYKLNNVSEVF